MQILRLGVIFRGDKYVVKDKRNDKVIASRVKGHGYRFMKDFNEVLTYIGSNDDSLWH